MSEAYLIAMTQRESDADGSSVAAQALDDITKSLGGAKRLTELHWFGDNPPFESLAPDVSAFAIPDLGALDHLALHNAARAAQMGEKLVTVLGQSAASPQDDTPLTNFAAVVAVASPQAVGRYNWMPGARLGARLVLPAPGENLLPAAADAIDKIARATAERIRTRQAARSGVPGMPEDDDLPETFPTLDTIAWVACADALPPQTLSAIFPNARRILSLPPAPHGDLFLLISLVNALRHTQSGWGLLLSSAGAHAALGTLVEVF